MINKERFKIGDVVWCKKANKDKFEKFPGLKKRLHFKSFYGIIVGWTYRKQGYSDWNNGEYSFENTGPSKFVWLVREKPNGRQYDVPDELAEGLPKDQPLPMGVAS